MAAVTPEQVEKKLHELLVQYKLTSKLTVAMIKDWVWQDEGEGASDSYNRYQKKWYKYFRRISDINKLQLVLQMFVEAWNYFPHQSQGGKSPNQIMTQALKDQPSRKSPGQQKLPDMIVGGQRMSWDDYWAMLKEMERQQVPFKHWIEGDLLPKYRKYLEQTLTPQTVTKHFEVADIFFERVRHVGFVTLEKIRPEFIQREFPKWWQTHIMMSNLSERQVLSSLGKLFQFIELVYNKAATGFGFKSVKNLDI